MHRPDVMARLLAPITACLACIATAAPPANLERQAIAANDGWASARTEVLPAGTTGGSAAAADAVVEVRDRNALVAALAFPSATPKIIRVVGTIDGNVDASGQPLACSDYARTDPDTGEPYSLPAYLAAYDPATWGRVAPTGPQERARVASVAAQQARVRIRIPANTTIVGVGVDAKIVGAWFDIRPSSTSGNQPMNVIIRNLAFEDSYDCFPAWAPTDGAEGNWNSLYDSISVRNATHVWIDHNRFQDLTTADALQPTYFNRPYQVHDGFVDVTNESDFVTVSWNVFADHDKAMLFGSSDGAVADRGKLRVTLHHNLFRNLGQRLPRVRYGQVHVYNNVYLTEAGAAATYGYSWGAGIESSIYAQNNVFIAPPSVTADRLITRFNGTQLFASQTMLNNRFIDAVAAFNAAAGQALLTNSASWTPVLFRRIDPIRQVYPTVRIGAGVYD